MTATMAAMKITLHDEPGRAQGDERFTVELPDGRREELRVHDYDKVYAIPGLYEAVVQERLECASPQVLADALTEAVADAGEEVSGLRVLDMGAGNGVVAEALREGGVSAPFVGLDPEPAAAPAAARDRPGLYRHYFTATLDQIRVAEVVAEYELTCLAGAGALGLGHVTRHEIETAWSAFGVGSWLAVTFSEEVLGPEGGELGDFVVALQGAADTDVVRLERFRHRLTMSGEELFYHVLVARRRG